MKLNGLFQFYNKSNKKCKRDLEDINYNKFNKMIKDESSILIDVRSKQEYLENHLDGAINIPLDEIKHQIKTYVPDFKKNILLYCQYGSRSKKAQNILKELGYKNIYNLKGGIEAI